jgi:hypothetical protein
MCWHDQLLPGSRRMLRAVWEVLSSAYGLQSSVVRSSILCFRRRVGLLPATVNETGDEARAEAVVYINDRHV